MALRNGKRGGARGYFGEGKGTLWERSRGGQDAVQCWNGVEGRSCAEAKEAE